MDRGCSPMDAFLQGQIPRLPQGRIPRAPGAIPTEARSRGKSHATPGVNPTRSRGDSHKAGTPEANPTLPKRETAGQMGCQIFGTVGFVSAASLGHVRGRSHGFQGRIPRAPGAIPTEACSRGESHAARAAAGANPTRSRGDSHGWLVLEVNPTRVGQLQRQIPRAPEAYPTEDDSRGKSHALQRRFPRTPGVNPTKQAL